MKRELSAERPAEQGTLDATDGDWRFDFAALLEFFTAKGRVLGQHRRGDPPFFIDQHGAAAACSHIQTERMRTRRAYRMPHSAECTSTAAGRRLFPPEKL